VIRHEDGMAPTITVGGLYEDCSYHPCICTSVDGDNVEGISLIDGSSPRGCSVAGCGPTAVTVADAVLIKANFAHYAELRSTLGVKAAVSRLG
jgi:hypothetical protein